MGSAGENKHDLSTTPLAELLIALQRDRASGELLLARGRASKALGLFEGNLVSVETSLPSETLCARLRDSGRLPEEAIARAERRATESGKPQTATIASLGLLEPKELFEELRKRMLAVTREAMLWSDGSARFDPTRVPPEATRAFRCELLPLVHATLSSAWSAERIANDLIEHFSQYPSPRDGFPECARSWLADDAATVRLVSLLDGDRTLEAVIGATFSEPALLAALWLADRMRLLRYGDAPQSGTLDERPPDFEIEVAAVAATAVVAPSEPPKNEPAAAAPAQASPESDEIRKEVLRLHESLGEWTHYEILGVDSRAVPGTIKKAYFTAAKRYHPDKLGRLGLGDIRGQASELFAAIAEAHEILSDTDRRRRYDDALASGGAIEDVDVTRIAQAESFFRKGEILVKMGDFRGASELLATAVELWPDECIYHATLGWALFRKNPPDNEGAADALRVAVGLNSQDAQAHLWLGQVLRALGDVNGAAHHAARARRLDPKVG